MILVKYITEIKHVKRSRCNRQRKKNSNRSKLSMKDSTFDNRNLVNNFQSLKKKKNTNRNQEIC